MVTYQQLKRHAEESYQASKVFSAEEKVAERVLALLGEGHNVESVCFHLLDDFERFLLERDLLCAEAIKGFLQFMIG